LIHINERPGHSFSTTSPKSRGEQNIWRSVMWSRVALHAQTAALLAAALMCASPTASAQSVGDREAGWNLARQWCVDCHVVDYAGHGADTAAIARERRADPRWLRAWLTTPHPPMPNRNLSGGEIDDVIAYLESLARP
jgi:mono/diheme cytochrome c family protein